jgi:hypothetical protein
MEGLALRGGSAHGTDVESPEWGRAHVGPLVLYEHILYVRTRWMSYRLTHVSSSWEEGEVGIKTLASSGLTVEVQIFEQLLAYLKELISLTPP